MDSLLPITRKLGCVDYLSTFEAMRSFTDARTKDTPDELWVVEHPPVFTLGLGADPSHVLDPHGIPIIQTDRGGEVTYHGPGQVIIYLLIDLRRRRAQKLLAREFVYKIEEAVIDTLAVHGLIGIRKLNAPGIYMAENNLPGAKIAALGLKIRGNGCTYHGVSLNVAMDLQPFSWINPCGYTDLSVTDMQSQGVRVSNVEIQDKFIQEVIKNITP